ncbi:MAG: glycogen/starch synthase, partial [Bullifex sp.]|nr:glycogen/starch synthase [Bullifex sp.]
MLTSETVPFSKSGGLADVVGALSSSIQKTGDSVKVMMPMYGFINRKGFKKETLLKIKVLGGEETVQ